jgi:hypothetical protein
MLHEAMRWHLHNHKHDTIASSQLITMFNTMVPHCLQHLKPESCAPFSSNTPILCYTTP